MIYDEMIRKLTIGTVIKTEIPRKKRNYISYKNRNGQENQILGFGDFDDMLSWFFIGIAVEGEKKFLKCVEKDPFLLLEFKGAEACFYGEKELSNIARHWFSNKGIKYARSMNAKDVNELLNVEVKPPNRLYTFKNGDYSPDSFIKHRHAPKGGRVKQSAYSYNSVEVANSSATDIVFIDKSYWLANKTISVEADCAYFGLGKVTKEGFVNVGHSLFKSDGESVSNSNTAYVRSMIYIDPEFFRISKLESEGEFELMSS